MSIGAGKILLVMQFYAGDKPTAMALSRLICDIEHEVCPWADFAFLARSDCEHDAETAAYMKTNFGHVHLLKSTRRAKGWPQGPNAMFMDICRIVHDKTKAGEWAYDAISLLESDDLPLRSTWIKELHDEWHGGTQLVLGDWVGRGDNLAKSHINGNLLFAPSLTDRLPEVWNPMLGIPVRAWDQYFWPQFAPVARASHLIFSDYRLGTRNHPWLGCESLWTPRVHGDKTNPLEKVKLMPCLLHGCKEPAGRKCVREKLLGPPVAV